MTLMILAVSSELFWISWIAAFIRLMDSVPVPAAFLASAARVLACWALSAFCLVMEAISSRLERGLLQAGGLLGGAFGQGLRGGGDLAGGGGHLLGAGGQGIDDSLDGLDDAQGDQDGQNDAEDDAGGSP